MKNNEQALREHQEAEGQILSEIIAFNSDMNTPLEFINDVAVMKTYYHKSIKLKKLDKNEYRLYIDGKNLADVFYNDEMNKYSAFDGVDGYFWHDTLKQAVKTYMDSCYHYQNPLDDDYDYDEVSCTSCGDGGCVHCEPHRFL